MTAQPDQFLKFKTDGLVAFREKRYAAAVDCFTQACQLHPDDAEMQERLGIACLHAQRLHEALDALQKSLALNPHRAAAYINAGAIYLRLGDWTQAVEHLQKGIQRNSKSPDAFFNLGMAYRKLDEPQLALAAFREVLRQRPQEWEALYLIGKVYRNLRQYPQELTSYRKALEMSPGNPRILKSLTTAELAQGQGGKTAQSSPFGRLVEPVSERQNASTTFLPALSEAMRKADRERVLDCAVAVELAARELADILRRQVKPVTDQLRTALIAGTGPAGGLRQKHQAYRLAARTLAGQQKVLFQKMVSLKQHEDQMLAQLEQSLR